MAGPRSVTKASLLLVIFLGFMNFEVDLLVLLRITPRPWGSRGDPKYIFFTLKTYKTAFVCDIL